MKFRLLKLFLLFAFVLSNAQENIFKSSDNPPNCKIIREGKFISSIYSPKVWYMIVKNDIQTEYFEDGKKYVKMKREFIADCQYKITIIEKSDENFPVNIGEVSYAKIVETKGNFIKIKYTDENIENGKEFEFLLEKINN